MSFLKKLFGGGSDKEATASGIDGQEEFEGYLIKAMLMRSGGEYQIAGTIEKDVDGERKVHKFVRADKVADKDDCVAMTLGKGRQIIREQGRTLFS